MIDKDTDRDSDRDTDRDSAVSNTENQSFDRVEKGSVRESLEQAFVEHSEHDEGAAEVVRALREKKDNIKEQRGSVESDSTDSREATSDSELDGSKFDGPDELKADWNHVPNSTKKYIKELIDSAAQMRQKVKPYSDMDRVFDTHLSAIEPSKRLPRDQIVKNMFQWLGAMTNKNYHLRVAALASLANNFGMDLEHAAHYKGGAQQDYYNQQEYQQDSQQQYQEQLYQQQIAQYRQEVQAAEQKHKPTIDSWSKAKPHFSKVRGQMASILQGFIQSGVIPASEDLSQAKYLELAYKTALEMNPAIAAEINKQRANKTTKRPQKSTPNNSVRAAIESAMRADSE